MYMQRIKRVAYFVRHSGRKQGYRIESFGREHTGFPLAFACHIPENDNRLLVIFFREHQGDDVKIQESVFGIVYFKFLADKLRRLVFFGIKRAFPVNIPYNSRNAGFGIFLKLKPSSFCAASLA